MQQICNRCVMDSSDPNISFDDNGFCNHCNSALSKNETYRSNLHNPALLTQIISDIKVSGKKGKYDCVIGVSGGVDSSYLLVKAVELGLRPLAFHVDNGWNSELAVKNIENLIRTLDVDLHTLVLDWDEFKELQRAYILSSVVDLEVLSDAAIQVGLFRVKRKYGIKYTLNGYNITTESIMPEKWLYQPKYDGLNIKNIYEKYGSNLRIRYYPITSLIEFFRIGWDFKSETNIPLLNYFPYDKKEAMRLLQESFGYTPYQYKHYESRITAFYQSYILPRKYNIDKRRAHLSSLICSGQISREDALKELRKPLMSERQIEEEKSYFLKKLNFTEQEFDQIMSMNRVEHLEFSSYTSVLAELAALKRRLTALFK